LQLRSFVIICSLCVLALATDWDGTQVVWNGQGLISWAVSNSIITLKFQVNKAQGYIGIGWGADDMDGADVVLLSQTNGQFVVSDCLATGNWLPSCDEIQNIVVVDVGQNDDETYFEFTRPLDTGEINDVTIVAGDTPVIWAYGTQIAEVTALTHHYARGSEDLTLVSS